MNGPFDEDEPSDTRWGDVLGLGAVWAKFGEAEVGGWSLLCSWWNKDTIGDPTGLAPNLSATKPANISPKIPPTVPPNTDSTIPAGPVANVPKVPTNIVPNIPPPIPPKVVRAALPTSWSSLSLVTPSLCKRWEILIAPVAACIACPIIGVFLSIALRGAKRVLDLNKDFIIWPDSSTITGNK